MPKSSRPEGPQQYISVSARHGSSVHCTWLISRDYRKCRMLLHELFAKLHDVNITPSTFLRISIGYRCVAESTTRLPSSVIKPSNCNNHRILLVYSRHTDSRVFWGHLRQTYCQHIPRRQWRECRVNLRECCCSHHPPRDMSMLRLRE